MQVLPSPHGKAACLQLPRDGLRGHLVILSNDPEVARYCQRRATPAARGTDCLLLPFPGHRTRVEFLCIVRQRVKLVANVPEPITLAIIETGSKLAVMSGAVHMSVRRIFDRLRMGTRAKLAGRATHQPPPLP